MGYIGITSPYSDIQVLKTSESLFVRRREVYTFFEIEVGPKEGDVFKRKDVLLTIAAKGKVKKVRSARDMVANPVFVTWYYSQKRVDPAGPGMRILMNDKYTKIVDCSVEVEYHKHSDVSLLRLKLVFEPNGQAYVNSIHAFFTFVSRNQVVSHRGSILVESRYFDRKLCPSGDYLENVVLHDHLVPIRKIYCWFVVPKGYIASDYTSFGEFYPRDARIAEPEYKVLLQNTSFWYRAWNRISDKLFGRPQIINWALSEDGISFNVSYKEVGKWDEIRLFVACFGFPLKVLFLYVAGIASIVGALVTLYLRR